MRVLSPEICLWHFFKGMSQADPGPQSPTSRPSQQELTGPKLGLKISCEACFQHHCLKEPFPAPCGDGGGENTLVWKSLPMLWYLGRLQFTLSVHKNPEVF